MEFLFCEANYIFFFTCLFFCLFLSLVFLLMSLQSRLPVVTIMEAVVICAYSLQSNLSTAVPVPLVSSLNQMERHASQVWILVTTV